MGKIGGFIDIERQDESNIKVEKRVKDYKEFRNQYELVGKKLITNFLKIAELI